MVFQIQIVNVTMSSMLGFVGHCSLTNEVYKNFLCDTTIRLRIAPTVFLLVC
jgi:hypothetical protein